MRENIFHIGWVESWSDRAKHENYSKSHLWEKTFLGQNPICKNGQIEPVIFIPKLLSNNMTYPIYTILAIHAIFRVLVSVHSFPWLDNNYYYWILFKCFDEDLPKTALVSPIELGIAWGSRNIINNYSPQWRWLVVDIYRAASVR